MTAEDRIEPAESPDASAPARRGCLARIVRSAIRTLLVAVALVAAYFGMAEVFSRLPGGGRPSTVEGPYLVYVTTNGVHVDLWLPVRTDVVDWSSWIPQEVPLAGWSYASFGWGDEAFYTQVPTWDDLTFGVAVRGALLPTPTAMRVMPHNEPDDAEDAAWAFPIGLQRDEYVRLVEHVRRTFQRDANGAPRMLDHPGYTSVDRFFAAEGQYHLFRTCNEWVSNGLREAGIEMPAWTPLERNVVRVMRARNR